MAGSERLFAAEAEIARRARQQSALAELGQAALTRADVNLLVGQTCALVEWALGASYVSIVRMRGSEPALCFGVGSNTTFTSCNDAAPGHRSPLTSALAAGAPVVIHGADAEAGHLRDHHGIAAGVCLPIPGHEIAYGVLTIYSDSERRFFADEMEFLGSIADLAGAVILSAEREAARLHAESERARGEDRFRAMIENASDGIALVDANGTFLYAAQSTERVLGYREDELLGRNFAELVHEDDLEVAKSQMRILRSTPDAEVSGEVRLRDPKGEWRWIEGTYKNLLFNPAVRAIVINYRDVTARKLDEELLQHLAYRDPLTDLPNRFLFHDRLEQALEQARRRGSSVAVMYVDLDRFKVVNDTLGHTVGDQLLQIVARRLRECLRADDTIARLGGDEFAVILPDVQRPHDAGVVARKLIAALHSPIVVAGHELHVSASAGISIFPGDGTDVVTLIKHADAALYRSKDMGRNNVQMFASSMNRRYAERLELELSLHRAIEHREFELVYQPICDRATRSVHSLEALVRWNRPGHGQVNPSDFIRLAEETRLIIPIGEWVLRTACEQLKAWHDAGLRDLRVAVNLSPHDIAQPDFIRSVHDTLVTNGLNPQDLELEITEGAALQNLEWTLSVLDQLRGLGVRIAVDDFGTGQSSMIYLKRLPLTTLKIDREFLRDVQRTAADAAIFSSIVQLGHSLGLYVIAEGVEAEEDRLLVESHACDAMQGFLFARPLPAADVPAWLRTFRYPAAA